MRTLAIDRSLFLMAFGRDVDYHDMVPQRTWLDRSTGDVLWFYESDEDAFFEGGIPAEENREERERVEAEPERYLEIPGLDHGEHHGILREFLRSDWTVRAFREYQEARIAAMAEEFLRENGIVPEWEPSA